jgi:hypothetical protein
MDFFFTIQNSKSSLHPVPACTLAQMPTSQSIFSQNIQQFCLLCTPCTCSMPTWQSSSESLVIMVLLSKLTARFFSMHHSAYAQCPLGRALHRTHSRVSVCNYVSHTQPCLQGIQQPSGLSPELLTLVLVPQHIFV